MSRSRQPLKTFCLMKTQISITTPKTSLKDFQNAKIKKGQLIRIKGGDGDTPPDDGDGVIGIEDIVIP